MCVLCGELVMNVHWTDQQIHDKAFHPTVVVGESQRDRMRNRLKRVAYANQILSYYGLTLRDWNGSKYMLADKKGVSLVVNDLGDMWPAVQTLTFQQLDPLEPDLLAFLSAHGEKNHE